MTSTEASSAHPSRQAMGLPQETFDMDNSLPFPAPSKQAAVEINGTKTDVTSISFADKIMITVMQNGRLAQWVCF